jgi:methylated-DNA-[protein]-cysteine S-methyltransferase
MGSGGWHEATTHGASHATRKTHATRRLMAPILFQSATRANCRRSSPAMPSVTFESSLGFLRLTWSERGPSQLAFVGPEPPPRSSMVLPPLARSLVEKVRAHLAGDLQRLEEVPVDWASVAPFARAVYEAARACGAGQVTTYGELASAIGRPGGARAVGQALRRNPLLLLVPCHRVLSAAGLGGFTAPGGLETKRRLLAIEREAGRRGAPEVVWSAQRALGLGSEGLTPA